jgi:hypothetical protein
MEFKIPSSLKSEHEELHTGLNLVIRAGGRIGEAGEAVAEVLHPHFVKEEEYALPPLGLLCLLAEGKLLPGMKDVLSMTDRLKAELPRMLEEHRAIVGRLGDLVEAANQDCKPEFARFAERLILHAKTEEEVFYPASILIGDLLKLSGWC